MDKRRLIIGGVLLGLVIIAVAAGVIYYSTNTTAREQILQQLEIETAGKGDKQLVASGFIEAEEVELAAEIGGRVVELPYEEGDEVQAGVKLAQLDTSLLAANHSALLAQLDIAIAQRDMIEAGPREEIIRQAEGQVALAQASTEAAKVAWQDALAMHANPQDLEIQLVEAQTQVAVAQQELAAAQIQLDSADKALEIYDRAVEFFEDNDYKLCFPYYGCTKLGMQLDMALTPQQHKEAYSNYTGAQESLADAQSILETIQGFVDNPQVLLAQAVQAEGAFTSAEAALERAKAELAQAKSGPREEDLMVAEAQIQEAEAALEALEAQIARMEITSPISGVILQQSLHKGELAVPGVPIITLANLDVVELTVYIAETDFDKIALNQTVDVTVDSEPGKVYEGVVTYIADEAEFTPRNVQTKEERVNLVFAVKIQIDNPDHELKPGMPADAEFLTE